MLGPARYYPVVSISRTRNAPPAPITLGEGQPECVECHHTNGEVRRGDGRRLMRALGFRLQPRLIVCGDTHWHEDDELRACSCKNPVHSA